MGEARKINSAKSVKKKRKEKKKNYGFIVKRKENRKTICIHRKYFSSWKNRILFLSSPHLF